MPEGADADGESEFGAELFEGEAGTVGDGVADLGFVRLVEGDDAGDGWSRFDFLGGLEASMEPADELGGNGVGSRGLGVGHAAEDIVENAAAEIEGKGLGHVGSSRGNHSMTELPEKRNRVPENALGLAICEPRVTPKRLTLG